MTEAAGFFGKIPSRGDFVRGGLDPAAAAALDDWCQTALPLARDRLGAQWVDAWMEAPIWRFRLRAGLCGPDQAAGVWLPSTDRAGRLFPLMLLRTGPDLDAPGAGLDGLEAIGLAAVERDLDPAAIAAQVATVPDGPVGLREGEWSTAGSPRVAPATLAFSGFPDGDAFAAMLGANWNG